MLSTYRKGGRTRRYRTDICNDLVALVQLRRQVPTDGRMNEVEGLGVGLSAGRGTVKGGATGASRNSVPAIKRGAVGREGQP